ncbi:MAG: alpha/beta hydrolase [Gammaproteobacteria bacterium]|nr:alpha/beta hydrolase [Gammaproteobacteria bacterium]MBL6998487.1 alpha/beta hydrolase [Gammaproteobacteria bacterium]
MKTESFQSINPLGLHRLVYQEWGERDNPRVIICVHGLARNSRDFDELAWALSRDYRVVCPDVVGRGQSDWLPAGSPYGVPQYVQDMVALIARLNVSQLDWIGTSMGGLIGMVLAAYPESPIQRLVLNDVGPFVAQKPLSRIGRYVGQDQRFNTLDEVEALLRQHYSAYRGLSAQQWSALAQHGSRRTEDGRFALHYDPVIGEYTRAAAGQDIDLWALWQKISGPQLLMWGEDSDVLTADTVNRMQQLNDRLELSSWPGIGHAPSLMEPDQIRTVLDWLQVDGHLNMHE